MVPELSYLNMKGKMPEIKELFQTRHYIQCASLCERLLTRSHNKIHPLHLAFLNFYLALCHDTLARDTALRHRQGELILAERHYNAALSAITPSEPQKLEDIAEKHSPISSDSEHDHSYRRASTASLHSDHSTSTSATSIMDEAIPPIKSAINGTQQPAQPSPSRDSVEEAHYAQRPTKRRPTPIVVPKPSNALSVDGETFIDDLASFTSMLKAHLASVRELKGATREQNSRRSYSLSRSSTIISRPISMDTNYDSSVMEGIRQRRKTVSFRPRFDPTSVRALCRDALNEL